METDIAVCIRQVPDTIKIKISPAGNTSIRTGMSSITNPFDKDVPEIGLQLKGRYDGKVTMISTGPPQARAVLREVLAMGVDGAYPVTDRTFGGSDTYTTSYVLPQAIKKLGGPDVILGSRQATDGDTGQMAPSITECLEAVRPMYTPNTEAEGGEVVVRCQTEESAKVAEVSLPVLCIAAKKGSKPRYATIKGVLNSLRVEIGEITLASLSDPDTTKMGLKGSLTKIKAIFTSKRDASCMSIEGNSLAEAAETLTDRLAGVRTL